MGWKNQQHHWPPTNVLLRQGIYLGKVHFETQHSLVRAAVYLGWCLTFLYSRLSHHDRGSCSPAHLFHVFLFISCANALQPTLVLITFILGSPVTWQSLSNPWALCLNSLSATFHVTFSPCSDLEVSLAWLRWLHKWWIFSGQSVWWFERQSLFLSLLLHLVGHLGGVCSPSFVSVSSYVERYI